MVERIKSIRPKLMEEDTDDNILIIGDSVLKEVGHIRNATVRSFRGDTFQDLNNHLRFEENHLLKAVVSAQEETTKVLQNTEREREEWKTEYGGDP